MTILPADIERLARLVGAQTGQTTEQVIREALEARARLAGVKLPERRLPRREVDLDRVREITRRIASQPLRDTRSPKDILDDAWGSRG